MKCINGSLSSTNQACRAECIEMAAVRNSILKSKNHIVYEILDNLKQRSHDLDRGMNSQRQAELSFYIYIYKGMLCRSHLPRLTRTTEIMSNLSRVCKHAVQPATQAIAKSKTADNCLLV